jgi:hypothetical protein
VGQPAQLFVQSRQGRAGTMSANAAAIEAGIRKKPAPLAQNLMAAGAAFFAAVKLLGP